MIKVLHRFVAKEEYLDVTDIVFPTGEKHIRIEGGELRHIQLIVQGLADLMELGMAVDICRRKGASYIELVMPFIPYARQDQVYLDSDPLSIKVFAGFLNHLKFDRVLVYDPHSIVSTALIDNVHVAHRQSALMLPSVLSVVKESDIPVAIVAPDLGASKKAKELFSLVWRYRAVKFIQADKSRDPETGQIESFNILSGDPGGTHCILVDDICDGGGTFLGLAQALATCGAIKQSLFVTHGIFSKGTEVLLNVFDEVRASDSFPPADGVTVIPTDLMSTDNEQLTTAN